MVTSTRRATLVVLVAIVASLGVGTQVLATGSAGSDGPSAVQETTTVIDEAAAISVQNLSAPSRVRIGDNFTVAADIVNDDDQTVLRHVTYRIENNVIARSLVRVPEGATERVTFNVTSDNTSGFPAQTYSHGVFTRDANATTELTLVSADETTSVAETTTAQTTTAETTDTETTPATTAITTTTTPATTTPADTTTPAATATPATRTASVTFESQNSTGTTVTVESVTVPDGGFVVLHDITIVEGNVVGSVVGQSEFLAAGTSENVTIELDEPLNESQRLVAVVYRDSNENREFDFVTSNRTVDGPYTGLNGRESVNDIANVTVETEDDR